MVGAITAGVAITTAGVEATTMVGTIIAIGNFLPAESEEAASVGGLLFSPIDESHLRRAGLFQVDRV